MKYLHFHLIEYFLNRPIDIALIKSTFDHAILIFLSKWGVAYNHAMLRDKVVSH